MVGGVSLCMGGCSHCPCVLVMHGDVEKVVVNVAHRMGVPCQWFHGVSLLPFGCLSFAGGRLLLFVDGASLWWAGGHCAWGCQCHPSALWVGVCGVEKAIVDMAHPSGCAMSATWWWVSLSSLVVPRLLGIHCGECHCRHGTPGWVCHVSCLVVGVVVGVCIVDFIDDVDDMGMGLTWHCGGHDGGVGWWWLRGRDMWPGLCQHFPI